MSDKEFKAPVGNPEYDLDAHRDETTTKAISAIFKIWGKHADDLSFDRNATQESVRKTVSEVAQEMLEAIIESNVPDMDMQHLIQNFQVIHELLFKEISNQVNGFQKELIARTIGTRNPKDGTYSKEYATIGDMYLALTRVRDEQGNNPLDYYYHRPNAVDPMAPVAPEAETAVDEAPAEEVVEEKTSEETQA